MTVADLQSTLDAISNGRSGGEIMRWKVLNAGRPRPLLVPAGNAQQAHAAVTFFIGSRPQRWLAHALLLGDRSLPSLKLLPQLTVKDFPAQALFGAKAGQSGEAPGTAIFCGSPGPLQKLTLYRPAASGAATRFGRRSDPATAPAEGRIAKLAAQASADPTVAREAEWLRRLASVAPLRPALPRLLNEGTAANGRRFLTMSALPPGDHAARFGKAHREFLVALASSMPRPKRLCWAEAEPFQRLGARLEVALPLIDAPWQALLEKTYAEIRAAIGDRFLPVCPVHGDFAPWNLRLAQRRLHVFDWEYAEAGGSPLQDFLHFHLASQATRPRWRSLGRVPSLAGGMSSLLAAAEEHAASVFGRHSGVGEVADALTAHYLLDTIAFYVEFSGYLAPQHPVMRAYLELLERRGEWWPARETSTGCTLETIRGYAHNSR